MDTQPTTQKDKLQAVAISPDEKFVVFITGVNRKSEISVSRLLEKNERFSLENVSSGIKLDKSLSHPKKSAIAVQATASAAQATGVWLRVIIAHCDGTHEIKSVKVG